ncbi:MAG: exopolyphosphatase [Bacteroidia bacterium]|nr:ethanolamine ammonia-lyase reactivating factor EutA [Bacteroidia bacterium]NNC85115.1 exopolyphosphatase [Bacteroidia bacterium]NNM16734.1 exopolyphosphatase [Bacteroidia bacterium]
MNLAAVDIGSNAVRLLLCNVVKSNGGHAIKKSELLRVPLRLGNDSFSKGHLTPTTISKLHDTLTAFKLLMKVNEVVDYRICATSALRDATNNKEIVKKIKKDVGLQIEIIDGKTEAKTIVSNRIAESMDHRKSYLYIDVGGGSTELTLFSKNKPVASKSLNIGTLRILYETDTKEEWEKLDQWLNKHCSKLNSLTAIGSGGNINKIYKMSRLKSGELLSVRKLKEMHNHLKELTLSERIQIFGLKPDRADVIVPASKIFLTITNKTGIKQIFVPQFGLSDGIVHELYEKNKKKYKALIK